MDPLYSKIKNDIEKKIKDGTYKAGLPLNTKYAASIWY